jgi:UDP-N-acetylmuramyl pentapeptide phosphotransferase/UDP-N-acetylglucosamine-1-phosphate transferase
MTIAPPSSAAVFSAVLIRVLGPWLGRYAVAKPNARSSHKTPTPQDGGITGIGATLVVSGGALFVFGQLSLMRHDH